MLAAATEDEMAVGPRPASTAARTASFDGNSSWMRNASGLAPRSLRASSKTDLVPDPGSRRTHSPCIRSRGIKRGRPTQGCSGPTTMTSWIARYRPAGQMLVRYGSFDETKLRCPTLDRRCDLGGIADAETYADLRIGSPKGDQVARQPIVGDRLACLN